MAGRPKKLERNRDLVEKRLANPSQWSFSALGKHFNIHKTTAEEIFKRDKDAV